MTATSRARRGAPVTDSTRAPPTISQANDPKSASAVSVRRGLSDSGCGPAAPAAIRGSSCFSSVIASGEIHCTTSNGRGMISMMIASATEANATVRAVKRGRDGAKTPVSPTRSAATASGQYAHE